ncbi:tRNA lysidine(34) synthetase TilS [Labrenzia sp. CE80]|uniref:tRNA lysidine(34) synthetase TilS n=1 Tax=Labrenzia sp. CE80 TaxID=1788986 RepID=UPI00138A1E27|nr:tRNA lysidine(34) synthetase TilS [Labrenzia sp. CE80]
MRSAPELHACDLVLSSDQIDQTFKNFHAFSCLAIGVSGGSDSLALLRLLHDWQQRSRWPGRFLVLTVDHGLRNESAQEAEFVDDLCQRLGVDHRTLRWTSAKPTSNLQDEARKARYRLFAEAMSEANAEALVLAHHKDDQVETFLDRLTRGSGVYGLGAMRADELAGPEGLRLLRPLLGVPKSQLQATLQQMGQGWCHDPSNDSTAYKRVRLRHLAAELAAEGLDVERVVETAGRLRRAADAIDAWVGDVLQNNVDEHPAGPLGLLCERYSGLPEEVRLRLLSRLILRVTGNIYPPRLAKLEALDLALCTNADVRLTLGGAQIVRFGDRFCFWKEAGRRPLETINLCGPGSMVWDERFRVSSMLGETAEEGMMIGPLAAAPTVGDEFAFPEDIPKDAFATCLAIWRGDKLLLVPGLFHSDPEIKASIAVDYLRKLPMHTI